jgi:uncharacterized membrane protein
VTPDELDALWKDPAHWSRDTFYSCATDPRLLVPKRRGGGWTINMGHPRAQVALWLVLLLVVALVSLAALGARTG